jgi:hypothetical protein
MWGVAHPLFVRSSRRKDAASIEKRLEKLSQRDNSYLLLAIREGAVETSLEKLGNLSAPNTSPSLQLEGVGTEDDIETCFRHSSVDYINLLIWRRNVTRGVATA